MNGYSSSFRRIFVSASILALTIVGFVPFSHADSPATRAARLTFMQGTVTVTEPGNAPVPAQLNLPLLSGLQLSTGQDGQAEVEFEDGSVVRLTPNSALSLDNLAVDPAGIFTTDLSLLRGLAYLELRATPQYRYSLNAGGDVVSPVENTTIRVNFDQPPAAFAVLDGTAHVDRQGSANGYASGSGYQADVRAGETLRSDAANPSRYFLTQGIDADSWDQWNDDLDQAADAQSSDSTDVRNNYAGAQGYGWSDLDANGNWYNVPGTGPVWQPYSAVDDSSWDPYGNGGWMSYPGLRICLGFQPIPGAGRRAAAAAGPTSTASAGAGLPARAAEASVGDSPAAAVARSTSSTHPPATSPFASQPRVTGRSAPGFQSAPAAHRWLPRIPPAKGHVRSPALRSLRSSALATDSTPASPQPAPPPSVAIFQ